MTDQPQLKRDGTMAVTAQEGKEFLENQGMQITDDDVKTRAQKEKLEEITAAEGNETNGTNGAPQLTRDGTMAVTAKEGEALLQGEELGGTRSQTAQLKEQTTPTKPKVVRDSTMAATAKEGAALLDGEQLEKTRAQTANSKEEAGQEESNGDDNSDGDNGDEDNGDEDMGNEDNGDEPTKPAIKRTSTMAQTAKEGEEFLARESKRAKEAEDDGDGPLQQEEMAEA